MSRTRDKTRQTVGRSRHIERRRLETRTSLQSPRLRAPDNATMSMRQLRHARHERERAVMAEAGIDPYDLDSPRDNEGIRARREQPASSRSLWATRSRREQVAVRALGGAATDVGDPPSWMLSRETTRLQQFLGFMRTFGSRRAQGTRLDLNAPVAVH